MPLRFKVSYADNQPVIHMSLVKGESVQDLIRLGFNVAGYIIKLYIKFPTPLTLSTEDDGITIIEAATGTFRINISDARSAGFPRGGHPYEIWTISGGDESTRLWSGTFNVLPSITPIP